MLDLQRLTEVEKILKYDFKDKSLLATALTHSSYANEHGGEDNEKLEFLGDSVLNFLVAEKLYLDHVKSEGAMTVLRSKLVSMKPLAQAVEKMGLLKYLQLGSGLKLSDLSVKARSNLFETLLAAIYLDGGIEAGKKFVFENIRHESIFSVDYKSRLQECLQAGGKMNAIKYEDVLIPEKTTPEFESRIFIEGEEMGSGRGKRKKEAQQQAAKEAMKRLGIIKN